MESQWLCVVDAFTFALIVPGGMIMRSTIDGGHPFETSVFVPGKKADLLQWCDANVPPEEEDVGRERELEDEDV